jgi:hypothetical protein
MFFFRSSRGRSRQAAAFRPAVRLLEDRTVPSGLAWHVTPGPATQLDVIVPESVNAGQTFHVIVKAEDARNHLATGFTGSVSLAVLPSDPNATLPMAYTFTPRDHGEHVFKVTLQAAGSETIQATGTLSTGTVTGSGTTTVNPAPVATKVVVITPQLAAVGAPTRVTVEVEDQSGHLLKNYAGTVTLSSTDTTATGAANRHTTAASLPITYTFSPHDHGMHTFEITFNETAAATGTSTTVTASATTSATPLTGSATLTVYPASTVTHFGLWTPPLAIAGYATPVFVEALNASNQVVTGYTGTINFTSSDAGAKISAMSGGTASALASFTYTFTSTDAGVHQFWMTFATTGVQTVMASDVDTTAQSATRKVEVVKSLRWHLFP